MPVLGLASGVRVRCGLDDLLSREDFAQVVEEDRLDPLLDALLSIWPFRFSVEFSGVLACHSRFLSPVFTSNEPVGKVDFFKSIPSAGSKHDHLLSVELLI